MTKQIKTHIDGENGALEETAEAGESITFVVPPKR
jgi:hypothetical protein